MTDQETTETEQHTPPPYHWQKVSPVRSERDVFYIRAADGTTIAEVLSDNVWKDATFIVRACNSHDELVAKLVRLVNAAAQIVNYQHAGVEVAPHEWSELFASRNAAAGVLDSLCD